MEPRACANENAAHEPVRAVVAIRRACIWSVSVIAIRAIRSSTDGNAYRPYADSNSNLRLRIRQRQRQHRKQCQIFHVFHTVTSTLFLLSTKSLANYWNSHGIKKLRVPMRLISAILADFNHLRTSCRLLRQSDIVAAKNTKVR